MTTIEKSIDVYVPLRTAYNQWTQDRRDAFPPQPPPETDPVIGDMPMTPGNYHHPRDPGQL